MRENVFYDLAKDKVLIVSHRGTSGGNIIQNHMLAFKNALFLGADIIEMDVILSKDKKLYVFHQDQEKQILHLDQDICSLTSKQIDELELYNWIGLESGYHINTLDEILDTFSDNYINIDRAWRCWPEIIDCLNKHHNPKILLKSHVKKELLDYLQENGSDIPYMALIENKEELDIVLKYDINLVAVELLFNDYNSEVISKEMFDYYKEKKLLTFVNAEKLSRNDRHILSCDLNDNKAIEVGFESVYGKLVDMGFNMIQTDWVCLLKHYLDNR